LGFPAIDRSLDVMDASSTLQCDRPDRGVSSAADIETITGNPLI
jgi:hypothetical protein